MKNFKKISIFAFIFMAFVTVICTGCDGGTYAAQANYEREARNAAYTSEYALTVNKLEKAEGDFQTYRRVVFYNVRLGDNVFACEGLCHVRIDEDGDVELVVKVGPDEYLRHYLGQKQDITYFSEQLKTTTVTDNYRYRITFNPKLWVPQFVSDN